MTVKSRAAFDDRKCRQRARLAARHGVEAAPLRMLGPSQVAVVPEGAELVSAAGILPQSEAEQLERVNAVLAHQGLEPLRADRVLAHYLEAGSSNYIPSRTMFLHESTLKNIAKEAGAGFAFMNSHRSGGLSSPAELPYGRTFAGRFESYKLSDGTRWSRSLLGVYMLSRVRPAGEQGPTTDEMSEMIDAGTIQDVSLGVTLFRPVCDVCRQDMRASDDDGIPLCRHLPGTTLRMDKDQRKAQEQRGVPGGVCTYSLHDGHAAEVSAVYNGAVPGAGFSRALRLAQSGRLGSEQLGEVLQSYQNLIDPQGWPGGLSARPARRAHHQRGNDMPRKLSEVLAGLVGLTGHERVGEDGTILEDRDEFRDDPAPAPAVLRERKPTEHELKLQEQIDRTTKLLEDERQARLQAQREARVAGWMSQGERFAEQHRTRLSAAQLEPVQALMSALAADDHDHPIKDLKRVDLMEKLLKEFPTRKLSESKVGAHENGKQPGPDPEGQTTVLSSAGEAPLENQEPADPVDRARKAAQQQNRLYLKQNGRS